MLHAITVNARTEPDDLLFRFDAVRRLADAQAGGIGVKLDDNSYWEPGPLWRAFAWDSACEYGSARSKHSLEPRESPPAHVVLVDEIDKADSDLPNSLLELLGQRHYVIPALGVRLGGPDAPQPLIVITSNEERELPAAFLRRCIVLNLEAPSEAAYADWLLQRGASHFSGLHGSPRLTKGVMRAAALQLFDDRQRTKDRGYPPGAAEYLDLLHAIAKLAPDDAKRQRALLDQLSRYAFVKHAATAGVTSAAQGDPPFDQRRAARRDGEPDQAGKGK
jgi:MoxR-like ATPase